MSDNQTNKSAGQPVEEDILLDHAYDGIQEYDNPMPRWWVWMFWGSFWFSLAYIFHFWIGNGTSLEERYAAEMEVVNAERAKAALEQQVSEQSLSQVMADAASLAGGKEVFISKCAACHKEDGGGLIGPNLTDNYWIHGKGALMDIYVVIDEGIAAKGMPAWGRQLSPTELRQVVAYVGTMRGSNVEGKAPEGEPVE